MKVSTRDPHGVAGNPLKRHPPTPEPWLRLNRPLQVQCPGSVWIRPRPVRQAQTRTLRREPCLERFRRSLQKRSFSRKKPNHCHRHRHPNRRRREKLRRSIPSAQRPLSRNGMRPAPKELDSICQRPARQCPPLCRHKSHPHPDRYRLQ